MLPTARKMPKAIQKGMFSTRSPCQNPRAPIGSSDTGCTCWCTGSTGSTGKGPTLVPEGPLSHQHHRKRLSHSPFTPLQIPFPLVSADPPRARAGDCHLASSLPHTYHPTHSQGSILDRRPYAIDQSGGRALGTAEFHVEPTSLRALFCIHIFHGPSLFPLLLFSPLK